AGRDLGGHTFAVRARRVGEHAAALSLSTLERRAGAALGKSGRVDLAHPEVEVRVVIAAQAHVGRLLAGVDRPSFEARAVKNRPFFSPVSLHPRFARALANLARVRRGERVLDPFCGTGGVALECGLVGARVFAGDIDGRMVAGTRETLVHYGVQGGVVEDRDVGEAPEFAPGVDAIVTDPPYGRASMTAREDIEALYARFFAAAQAALRSGGRLATVLPEPALVALGARRLALEAEFPYKVHGSLTRRFVLYRKPHLEG
ncbi:MAG TPA: methyltransferase, partial [Candidatus Thermoplasmatota archaeon]|nr:methyltransferase [Candidatus Thermoplasmatota archaeon]